jgi:hypothetical protein
VTRVNDALCVRIEDFEKFALSGHESTEHNSSLFGLILP